MTAPHIVDPAHVLGNLFRVSKQDDSRAVLHIAHDGVLLRGAGPDRTRIHNASAQNMRQSSVVLVGPEKANWQSWHDSESQQTEPSVAVTRDITSPTRTLHVADASTFEVGDWVILKSDITAEWLAEHPVQEPQVWTPTTFRALVYNRQITAVDAEAGTVEIDIPTRYRMLVRDGVRLHQHHDPVEGSGVADLAIGMRQSDLPHSSGTEHNREGTQGYEAHGAAAVSFNNAVNGWADNVHSFAPEDNRDGIHLLSGGVYIWYARSITVQDTDFRRAQYLGEGGNGYLYHLMGSDNLVRDAYAEKGRHNYLVQAVQGTGNVILDSHSVDATHATELHRHLGVANLFDNVSVDRDSFEMRYRTSSTHAHSGTESVMWNISGENCTRGRLAMTQQFGWGYLIGTTGEGACATVENPGGQHTEPRDWVEYVGAGEFLEPRSLYLDQLDRRLVADKSALPVWDAATVYDSGDRVLHDGAVYVAQWWTRGEVPGFTNTGSWMRQGEVIETADGNVRAWTSSWVYETGDTAVHDGQVWQAKWWNRNQAPGDPSGPWVVKSGG